MEVTHTGSKLKTALRKYSPLFCAAVTGLLLAAAFPPLQWDELAWFALIPLIITSIHAKPERAALPGFVAGLVFWGFSVQWLTHVTWFGWLVLSAYCALYFIPFSLFLSWWGSKLGVKNRLWNILLMFAAPVVWVALEYLRSVLFTGFAWNALGISQYEKLTVIQISRLGGVYPVSALIMMLNVSIAVTLMHYGYGFIRPSSCPGGLRRRWHPELLLGFLVLALVHADGARHIGRYSPSSQTLRAALIQPNIPQVLKWDADHINMIYDRLEKWTSAAVKVGNIDLAVWPETALPDEVRRSPRSFGLIEALLTNGVPILVGSMDSIWEKEEDRVYFYNSSFLFDTEGRVVMGYDKQHLVLFGEYVPFQTYLPFLSILTPISVSFSSGKESAVFLLEGGQPFSVLICFEDTVASLARDAVKAGGGLLINQTNDAWFDVSSGSRQHMAHCVFRCVENGVGALRAANTGVTCAIDPLGRIRDVWGSGPLPVRTEGFRIYEVPIKPADSGFTIYTRYGDVGAGGCLAATLGVALLAVIRIFIIRRRINQVPA